MRRVYHALSFHPAHNTRIECKVFRDSLNDEYVCKLYIGGKHVSVADYFTSDRDDAQGTADKMVMNALV